MPSFKKTPKTPKFSHHKFVSACQLKVNAVLASSRLACRKYVTVWRGKCHVPHERHTHTCSKKKRSVSLFAHKKGFGRGELKSFAHYHTHTHPTHTTTPRLSFFYGSHIFLHLTYSLINHDFQFASRRSRRIVLRR